MDNEFSLIEEILNDVTPCGGRDGLQRTLHFMDEMPGGFFIYQADEDEKFLYVNAAMLQIAGCADQQEFLTLTGGTFRGLIHPDDLEAAEKSIWQQIAQDDIDHVAYRICRKDGEIRWINDFGHFFKSAKYGNVFSVFATDMTEQMLLRQKERAELLRENDQKDAQLRAYDRELQSLSREYMQRKDMIDGLSVEYLSIYYVDLDKDMIQVYQSGRYTSSLLKPGQHARDYSGFMNEYVEHWVHPEDRAMIAAQVAPQSLRRELDRQRAVHINFRCQWGEQTEYLQMRIVRLGGLEPVSRVQLCTMSVDDKVRSAMEQQEFLADALHQARTAVAAKNAFLSNMSHDMRTPLNAIAGFTMLARRHADDAAQVRRYLGMIEVSGRQLLRLINNVLEIARIESGGEQLSDSPCDLREIAQRVRTSLYAKAATKNVNLSLDLSGLRRALVRGDERKLEEILYHLASNAVKYTEPGGHVTIQIAEQEATATGFRSYRLIVEDDGIGISQGFLEHIFESFAREQNTTLSGVYGTGLGLPIVKSIVEMMDGTIEVESEPRRGSRFIVTLPLRLQIEEGRLAAGAPAVPGQKLLIVEDNELNMEIARELLQDAGFSVDTAENGQVGLQKVRDSKPGEYALVLMDIQMPVMDGYQTARAIRGLEQPELAALPIVALSANAFEEDKRQAFDSGMNAHMPKPIEIEPLLETIEKLTGLRPGERP